VKDAASADLEVLVQTDKVAELLSTYLRMLLFLTTKTSFGALKNNPCVSALSFTAI
jgi:hypothetical protein